MGSGTGLAPDTESVEPSPPQAPVEPGDAPQQPFPGPRPFREDEHALFYGRARETTQLRSMVLANSLVLLYSASGAGKSSLIQAGLVPALRKRRAMVYPVLRIRPTGDEELASAIANPYVRGLAANWVAIADHARPRADGRSRAEDVRDLADLSELTRLLAETYEAPPDRPRVLIIDQLEELFTFRAEDWEQRGDVFAQIEAALGADRELSVLLAMREDYIAQTDPFAGLVSNYLQQRLRIETLREAQALQAVEGPLNGTGRSFAPGAAEALVQELLQIRIDRGRDDRKPDKVRGQYVEPVQLQVVCRRFWDSLPDTVHEITTAEVTEYANVDEALIRFYDDAVRAAGGADLRAREGRIRTWIAGDLITAGETRGTAHRDAALKKRVSAASLKELVDWHLLRTEWRNGSDWYEITHDRLIDPILVSNRRYQDRRTARRLRTAASVLVVMLGVVAAIALVLLTQGSSAPSREVVTRTLSTTKVVAVHVPSSSPIPPVISVPADGTLYQRGSVSRARYSCVSTSAWSVSRCSGTSRLNRPIDTSHLGQHRFQVTATYGRSAIVTTRNVSYTVVSFATTTYHGRLFTVAYPLGWSMQDAEARRPGNYSDTTVVSPSDPNTLLRVDVSSHPALPLKAAVSGEVTAVSRQKGYRLLKLAPTRVGHAQALDWQFLLNRAGTRVQEEDVFFDTVDQSGKPERIATLTMAPPGSFRRLTGTFQALRRSLIVSSAYYGPNCDQPGLGAEDYSMCQLSATEQCPTGFAPQAEPDGTDVCLNEKRP
jgi:hypothetical protein